MIFVVSQADSADSDVFLAMPICNITSTMIQSSLCFIGQNRQAMQMYDTDTTICHISTLLIGPLTWNGGLDIISCYVDTGCIEEVTARLFFLFYFSKRFKCFLRLFVDLIITSTLNIKKMNFKNFKKFDHFLIIYRVLETSAG